MFSYSVPQFVAQQGFELHREEPHLGCELQSLFANEGKSAAELGIQKYHCFPDKQASLGTSEG